MDLRAATVFLRLVRKGGSILSLIKPQFEVGKGGVGKGGVIKDPEKHKKVVNKLIGFSESLGLKVKGVVESPIKGAKGNKEFWISLSVPTRNKVFPDP